MINKMLLKCPKSKKNAGKNWIKTSLEAQLNLLDTLRFNRGFFLLFEWTQLANFWLGLDQEIFVFNCREIRRTDNGAEGVTEIL